MPICSLYIMDSSGTQSSLDVHVDCCINAMIVDVLDDLEFEKRQQSGPRNDDGNSDECEEQSTSQGSELSSVSSSIVVPSLKVLTCGIVKQIEDNQKTYETSCCRNGLLRFIDTDSDDKSCTTSTCSLSPPFSDLSASNVDVCCEYHTPQKRARTRKCTTATRRPCDLIESDIIRRQLAEAYQDGYQAATSAGVVGSQKKQIIAVQEKMLTRLAEERDHVETVLHMREQEWYAISSRLVSEIEDLRLAYNKLISERAHENVRLSSHAYRTMFRALYTNDKALSTSVELQAKINGQKLHMFSQDQCIARLEKRVIEFEERLASVVRDGGCVDEAQGEHDVLLYDRTRYTLNADRDPHYVLMKNFEIGGTTDLIKDCSDETTSEDYSSCTKSNLK